MSEIDIEAAERRELEARARLLATLHELQAKLNLKALTRQLSRRVAGAGETAARTGVDAARRNPAPLAGAAAIGLAILARHRIAGLFRRKHDHSAKDDDHA